MAPTLRTLPLALGLLATGCTYDGPGAYSGGDVGDGPEIPPVGMPAAQPCRAGETGVVLCVDFETPPDAGRVIDLSPYNHAVTAIEVTPVERFPGEQAALLKKESSLRVPEAAELDLAEYTIEMWVRPGPKPPKSGSGLFDQYAHYTMQIEEDLKVSCGTHLGIKDVTSDGRIPKTPWSHAVCRYVGGEMRVYLNGRLSGCEALPAPTLALAAPGSAIGARFNPTGTDITARFSGGVDNVRVYDHGLSSEQICAAAGSTGACEDVCPVDEEEDD